MATMIAFRSSPGFPGKNRAKIHGIAKRPTVDATARPERDTSYLNNPKGPLPAERRGFPNWGTAAIGRSGESPMPFSPAWFTMPTRIRPWNVFEPAAITRIPGMRRTRFVLRHLPNTLAVLSILGVTLLALSQQFLPSPRRLTGVNGIGRPQIHPVAYRQDAEPSFDGAVGWINSGPIDLA